MRQGLERIARKGGGRWAAGAAERPEEAPDRDYAAHGLPPADYERKARRRACEPGRPNYYYYLLYPDFIVFQLLSLHLLIIKQKKLLFL